MQGLVADADVVADIDGGIDVVADIGACKTSVTTLRIHAVKPNNKSFLKRLGEAQVVFLQ